MIKGNGKGLRPHLKQYTNQVSSLYNIHMSYLLIIFFKYTVKLGLTRGHFKGLYNFIPFSEAVFFNLKKDYKVSLRTATSVHYRRACFYNRKSYKSPLSVYHLIIWIFSFSKRENQTAIFKILQTSRPRCLLVLL